MFNKLRIRTRLLASYAIIVLLMIISGVYALNRLDFTANRTTELYEHPFTVRKSVRDATLNFWKMQAKLKDFVGQRDGAVMETNLREMSEAEKAFIANMEMVKERFLGK